MAQPKATEGPGEAEAGTEAGAGAGVVRFRPRRRPTVRTSSVHGEVERTGGVLAVVVGPFSAGFPRLRGRQTERG